MATSGTMLKWLESVLAATATATGTSLICVFSDKKWFCTLCTCLFHFCIFRSRFSREQRREMTCSAAILHWTKNYQFFFLEATRVS